MQDDSQFQSESSNVRELLKRLELSIHRFRTEWSANQDGIRENYSLLIELAEMQTALTALTVTVNRIRRQSG